MHSAVGSVQGSCGLQLLHALLLKKKQGRTPQAPYRCTQHQGVSKVCVGGLQRIQRLQCSTRFKPLPFKPCGAAVL